MRDLSSKREVIRLTMGRGRKRESVKIYAVCETIYNDFIKEAILEKGKKIRRERERGPSYNSNNNER